MKLGWLWPHFTSCSIQLPFSGFYLLALGRHLHTPGLCLLGPALTLGLAWLTLTGLVPFTICLIITCVVLCQLPLPTHVWPRSSFFPIWASKTAYGASCPMGTPRSPIKAQDTKPRTLRNVPCQSVRELPAHLDTLGPRLRTKCSDAVLSWTEPHSCHPQDTEGDCTCSREGCMSLGGDTTSVAMSQTEVSVTTV